MKWLRVLKSATSAPSWQQQKRDANRAKWRRWNWSKQDRELARAKGLSSQRIAQIRQLLDAPQSPNCGADLARLRRTTNALQWVAKNLHRLKGLSGAEVRRKYGIDPHSPRFEFLKAKGILRDGRYYRKHLWHLMNFDLPSGILERIWKLPHNVAASYRSRKRLAASKWTLVGGPDAMRRRGGVRAYNRAVQTEERKAAKFFAKRRRVMKCAQRTSRI